MSPSRILYITVSLIFILAVKPEPMQSQGITYFNYLNYTSKWYYITSFSGINGLHGFVHEFLYIDGDTIIGNEAYYKIRNLRISEQVSPVYGTTESNIYIYSLREDADSLFTYKYPDGTEKVYSNKPSAWPGNSITYFGGEIPHRFYWKFQSPTRGWVEGIGWGQIGGNYPHEPGSQVMKCYKRDSLSTDITANPCEFNYAVTAVEESKDFESISIHPNPVSNSLYLVGLDQQIQSIRIYSFNGAVLNTMYNVEVDAPIDVSSYNPGMYFIVLHSGDKNFAARFVIAY